MAALAQVPDHRLLVRPGGGMGGQGLAHRLMGGDGRLLARPAGGAGDQPLLDREQLGGGPAALLQGPVGDHADRPLGQEPVRQLLQLGPSGAGQAGAEGDQDVGAGEGGRVLGQPVRAGQPIEQPTGHRFGHRPVLVAVGCPAGHLPDQGVRVVSALGRLGPPAVVQGVRGLVLLGLAGGLDGPLDQPRCPLPPVRGQPVELGVDLAGALGEAADQLLGHALELPVAVGVRRRPLHPECPDELALVGGPVDGVRGQPMPVQVPAVQGRPASVRPLDAVGDDQMGVQQRVALSGRPVVEPDRQQPLSGHVLDTAMAAAGPQVLVQVADRLGQPGVMGGQHRPAGGRVAEAVEDRDALGRPQHHVEGRARRCGRGGGRAARQWWGRGPRTWPGTRPPMLRPPAPGCWRRRRTTGLGTHRGRTDTARGRWPARGCSRPPGPPRAWRCRPPPRRFPPRLRWRERTHPWCIALLGKDCGLE